MCVSSLDMDCSSSFNIIVSEHIRGFVIKERGRRRLLRMSLCGISTFRESVPYRAATVTLTQVRNVSYCLSSKTFTILGLKQ